MASESTRHTSATFWYLQANTFIHKIKRNNSFFFFFKSASELGLPFLSKFGTVKTLRAFGDGLNEFCIMKWTWKLRCQDSNVMIHMMGFAFMLFLLTLANLQGLESSGDYSVCESGVGRGIPQWFMWEGKVGRVPAFVSFCILSVDIMWPPHTLATVLPCRAGPWRPPKLWTRINSSLSCYYQVSCHSNKNSGTCTWGEGPKLHFMCHYSPALCLYTLHVCMCYKSQGLIFPFKTTWNFKESNTEEK